MDAHTELLREQQMQITGHLRSQALNVKLFAAIMKEQSTREPFQASVCGCNNRNLMGTPPSNLIISRESLAPDFVSTSACLVSQPSSKIKDRATFPISDPEWKQVGRAGAPAQTSMVHAASWPTRPYAGVPRSRKSCCKPGKLPVPAVKVKEIVPNSTLDGSRYTVQVTDTSVDRPNAKELSGLPDKRKEDLEQWIEFDKLDAQVTQDERNPFLYAFDPLTNSVKDIKARYNSTPVRPVYTRDFNQFRISRTVNTTTRSLRPWVPSDEVCDLITPPHRVTS